ncbi:MAG TPA: prepilin-type N-terminal cleavage/methylation domain-containing protein [Candidatus Acidoferrales bacterium]|nr:prepilin-type N-terminal cleavage/methylation domain-containing protein [Candidatus Acidoferrales bacterium]
MKRENGFSLIELMVSMAILVAVIGVVVGALLQAQHATQGVAYEANTQENLRAGMHFIVQDLMQAGEGIPQGGVSVPYNAAGISTIARPGVFPPTGPNFPNPPGNGFILMPAVSPGWRIGQDATTVNPATGAVLNGNLQTDVINILYADNILQDGAGHYLYTFPVVQAAGPACAGFIDPAGATVTLDATCFLMPGQTRPITVGNLIMFHNSNGTALEYVTAVNGQTIVFGGGDPAHLNATGLPNGTVANLKNAGGGFPPTSVTRVWMVTYYIDSTTNPSSPQLIRQLNYPNYPAPGIAAANPPAAIADNLENLSFSYDITGSNFPGIGVYPQGPGNVPTPTLPDTPGQIRAVNVFLAGRSEEPYRASSTPQFLRNNLSTQVSIRSLSFTDTFTTATQQTAP